MYNVRSAVCARLSLWRSRHGGGGGGGLEAKSIQRDTLRHDVPGELLCDMATRQKVHAACTMPAQLSVHISLSLAPRPKKISKHAPKKNQKAFAYGTGAGGGSHLADQEASGAGKTAGAGKAFAYGTGAVGSLRMVSQVATGAG